LQKFLLIALLGCLYLTKLGGVGFLGPDEPRYAAIGRTMARSGNWITPMLDGTPWFEKPPLLYWTTALGNVVGLSDEWAARLPVALLGLAFLWLYYRTWEREFSPRIALAATAILGTSVGWASLSFVAVTDLAMSAALNAALLVALFGPQALGRRDGGYHGQGWIAGILLGFAVLAKAFVPIVLFLPALLIARGKRRRILAGCLLTALPWHLLCYAQNGSAFWDVYFWQHQVGRFTSTDLGHVQPWWYYVPVLLAGLFPWTPLLGLLGAPRTLSDERVRFSLLFVLWGMIFFSASVNKLPAYVLPLLPSLALVFAVALERSKKSGPVLVLCSLLLAVIPAVAQALPQALDVGLTHVDWSRVWTPVGITMAVLVPGLSAFLTWWLAYDDADQEWSRRRRWTSLVVAAAAVAMVGYLKWTTFPVLDQTISVRGFALGHPDARRACGDNLTRDEIYGLSYYFEIPLPSCDDADSPRIVRRNQALAIVY
jgi:4-amino-4-deoxy-L-arabinose transferase-like glycosyltransferase